MLLLSVLVAVVVVLFVAVALRSHPPNAPPSVVRFERTGVCVCGNAGEDTRDGGGGGRV